MNKDFEKAIADVIVALEKIPAVRASSEEYLEALQKADDEIGSWLAASIDAAKDDVRR